MPKLNKLLTQWGETLNKEKPWDAYPRPQMERKQWINLNGPWSYVINKDEYTIPTNFDGEIIVPFSPECALSDVDRELKPDEVLWYKRTVKFDDKGDNKVLLHFGAVDQIATLYVNDQEVGKHEGGYWPFAFDITSFLVDGENSIVVSVRDFSDLGQHAYGDFAFGKQYTKRGGIWYTPQSGIWQTVWAEYVPAEYIDAIRMTPDYDAGTIRFAVRTNAKTPKFTVNIFDEGKVIATETFEEQIFTIAIEDFKSWSPENPFLYDVTIGMGDDEVKTYFGMRKFSIMNDENGNPRMALNNKPYFHNGLLDQGYWSDGMYTPPSDEAIVWEISKLKELGFNMLRKHIKVEPLRWYYHCDRLGMLVWQDFISGGGPYNPLITQALPFVGLNLDDTRHKLFARGDENGRRRFEEQEMPDTMNTLYNTVSLAVWVPFNEGWGQFDSVRIANKVKKTDPTRLVDATSGWHDTGSGDFHSPHVYFYPFKMKDDPKGRVQILSEFGGYSCPTTGHMASPKLFGYKMYMSKEKVTDAYMKLFEKQIIPAIPAGLSATVYTQVSDVEDEINGIFTYDRKVIKIDEERLKALNKQLTL